MVINTKLRKYRLSNLITNLNSKLRSLKDNKTFLIKFVLNNPNFNISDKKNKISEYKKVYSDKFNNTIKMYYKLIVNLI